MNRHPHSDVKPEADSTSAASVLVLQHAEPETPGLIADSLARQRIALRFIRADLGEEIPRRLDGHHGLLVMGGPMSVHDAARHAHLEHEMELIRRALAEGVPVLGVCLGSQLLAAALGARVRPGRKEIGWHSVRLASRAAEDPLWAGLPASFTPFHWHGDVFELPAGAEVLASSGLTPRQAFRHGRDAYGILFHMEVDEAMIRAMADAFPEDLAAVGTDGETLVRQGRSVLPEMRRIGGIVFDRWAARVRDGAEERGPA